MTQVNSAKTCPDCGRPIFRGVWGFEAPAATDCKAASEQARSLYVPEEYLQECNAFLISSLRQTIEAFRRIVKRTLASGQIEKLEDARAYLTADHADDAKEVTEGLESSFPTWLGVPIEHMATVGRLILRNDITSPGRWAASLETGHAIAYGDASTIDAETRAWIASIAALVTVKP